MKVTLTTKSSAVTISTKTFVLEQNNRNFLDQLRVEVIQNPKKARKLLKILSTTHTVFASMLIQTDLVRAAPTNLVPPDITNSILIAIAVIAALGVGIAILSLMIAGMWKMLFGKSRADDWTVNILKGLGQLLGAPILVALIVGIFTLLFSKVPAFQPIVSPITTFFHQ